MHKFFGIFIVLAVACNDPFGAASKAPTVYSKYFEAQIDTLLDQEKGLIRHTSRGEDIEQERFDTMTKGMWQKELHGFLNAPNITVDDTLNYIISNDISGKFEVIRYTAKDTLAPLRSWEQTKVNGAIELITWHRISRSLLMDREIEMTYQPQKGYRMLLMENAAWSAPKKWEIFAEFTKK